MGKYELEAARLQYQAEIAKVRDALRSDSYVAAVELAMSSCNYVDDMMQYERRYIGREFTSVEALDVVLKYGPLLFHHESLDRLATLLKEQRRIEKNTTADYAQCLAEARSLMWDAHCLWTHLSRQDEFRQNELRLTLGGEQVRWRSIAESWERMGVLKRVPDGGSYRLSFVTTTHETVRAKCSSCGVVGKAAKIKFLSTLSCPKCRQSCYFIILS